MITLSDKKNVNWKNVELGALNTTLKKHNQAILCNLLVENALFNENECAFHMEANLPFRR